MLRLKVVLDTNVVVSAHLNAEGLERFVLDLALTQKVQCYVSPEILAEYDSYEKSQQMAKLLLGDTKLRKNFVK